MYPLMELNLFGTMNPCPETMTNTITITPTAMKASNGLVEPIPPMTTLMTKELSDCFHEGSLDQLTFLCDC